MPGGCLLAPVALPLPLPLLPGGCLLAPAALPLLPGGCLLAPAASPLLLPLLPGGCFLAPAALPLLPGGCLLAPAALPLPLPCLPGGRLLAPAVLALLLLRPRAAMVGQRFAGGLGVAAICGASLLLRPLLGLLRAKDARLLLLGMLAHIPLILAEGGLVASIGCGTGLGTPGT